MVLCDACRKGDLAAVAAYFAGRRYPVGAAKMCAAFRAACSRGHFPVAQLLFGQWGGYSADLRQHAFELACGSGSLPLVQWLYGLGDIHIRARGQSCFLFACQRGRLAVAQWLHRLGVVDIHFCSDAAFQLALRFGKCRRVAQWLVHLHPAYPWHAHRIFARMRMWSSGRDVWMRAVARPPGNATAI